MKKLIGILLYFLLPFSINAQISGPSPVEFGDTAVYSNPAIGTPGYTYYFWKVTGGTLLEGQTETRAEIRWDHLQSGRVEKWAHYLNGTEYRANYKDVTINNVPALKYEYDLAGNRTHRRIIYLNSSKKSSKANDPKKTEEFVDMLDDLKITIWPNPTEGKLFVALQGVDPSFGSYLTVYNMGGAPVRNYKDLDGETEIDLTGDPPGMYIIVISANGKISQWKVIKK
jgi:hypothetical protein